MLRVFWGKYTRASFSDLISLFIQFYEIYFDYVLLCLKVFLWYFIFIFYNYFFYSLILNAKTKPRVNK